MSKDFSKSKWPEVRERIKMNWDRIDEEEIDHFQGKLDQISEKIQQVYSCSKERADRELYEFKKSLNSKKSATFYIPNKNIVY